MILFDILQIIGGIILSVGWIPQIIKIVKTKSVKDFKIRAYLSILVGIALMEIYALHLVWQGVGVAFFHTNTLSLGIVLIFVFLLFKYRNHTWTR